MKVISKKASLLVIGALLLIVSLLFVVGPRSVSAQDPGSDPSFSILDPLGGLTFTEFLGKLLDIAILIGTPVIIFFVVYSGFLFVTAQGNEQRLTAAKRTLLYTLIGAVILLGAHTISTVIKGTLDSL